MFYPLVEIQTLKNSKTFGGFKLISLYLQSRGTLIRLLFIVKGFG